MSESEKNELRDEMEEKGVSSITPIHAHKSRYVGKYLGHETQDEYFVIAVAYPRRENYDRGYAILFNIDDRFKEVGEIL